MFDSTVDAATGCSGSCPTPAAAEVDELAAPAWELVLDASTSSTTNQRSLQPSTTAGVAHKPSVRHQPRTRPTPTLRAELTSFEASLDTAFGTFHRYVYKPLKSRSLIGNAISRAGSASTAVFAEVVHAKQEATGGTAVRTLFGPLAALAATLNELSTKLERGQLDSSDIQAANGQIASIEQAAAAAGVRIADTPPDQPPTPLQPDPARTSNYHASRKAAVRATVM